jgi:hypothetical protein
MLVMVENRPVCSEVAEGWWFETYRAPPSDSPRLRGRQTAASSGPADRRVFGAGGPSVFGAGGPSCRTAGESRLHVISPITNISTISFKSSP